MSGERVMRRPRRRLVLLAGLGTIAAGGAGAVGASLSRRPAPRGTEPAVVFTPVPHITTTGPTGGWPLPIRPADLAEPLVAGGALFVTDLKGVLHAVDLSSASSRWSLPTKGSTQARLRLSGGLLITPLTFGNPDSGRESGAVWAVDAGTGTTPWRARFRAPVLATPVTASERLYAGAMDGELAALRLADGSRVWRVRLDGQVDWLRMASSTLYVASFPGVLSALDARDGAVRWRVRSDSPPWEFWVTRGERLLTAWEELTADSATLACIAASDGRVIWTYDGVDATPSPLLHGNMLVVPSPDPPQLLGIDADSGKRVWRYAKESLVADMALHGDVLLLVDGPRIVALDPSTGRHTWVARLTEGDAQDSGNAVPVVVGNDVVVGSEHGLVYGFDVRSGAYRWHVDLGGDLGGVVASPVGALAWAAHGPLNAIRGGRLAR
jgi:outer membrane protein assembly factor BamB